MKYRATVGIDLTGKRVDLESIKKALIYEWNLEGLGACDEAYTLSADLLPVKPSVDLKITNIDVRVKAK